MCVFHWEALQTPLQMKPKKFPLMTQTSQSDAEKRQNFTNEKLYSRIPTSVDAIIFTMQNGKYNAVLLTKIVLIDLTIYVSSTLGNSNHTIYAKNRQFNK